MSDQRDRRQMFLALSVVSPKPHHGVQHVGEPIMAFQLRDSEQLSVSAQGIDSEGNPTSEVIAAFASSDPTVASVTDNGDGTALIVASPEATGGLGVTTITATLTNPDGSTLEGSLELEVIAGDAVAVNIVTGTPEPKDQAVPSPEPEPEPIP